MISRDTCNHGDTVLDTPQVKAVDPRGARGRSDANGNQRADTPSPHIAKLPSPKSVKTLLTIGIK
jgi:hypothetical protein